MYWLIRATRVTSLTYRLLLTTMMTVYLIREGLSHSQRNKTLQLPPPEHSPSGEFR
jgi:hypothetical protein